MYTGYLSIADTEIVNNHRAASYARSAGFGWVRGCGECESISHLHGETFVTPLMDAENGSPPPWWDEGHRYDASRFLGFVGLDFAGLDDSTRAVLVQDANGDGGYIGALRYQQRTTVVSMLAVAVDECALAYGLEWLRSVDGIESCTLSDMRVYTCCPCVCGDSCDDPVCQEACVQTAARDYRDSRITSGPTVLSRREMTLGWSAQVELVITSADPKGYSVPMPVVMGMTTPGVPISDPPPAPPGSDPFGLPVGRSARTAVLPPRTDWRRTMFPVSMPGVGLVAPVLTLRNTNVDQVPDVRVEVFGDGPDPVFGFRVPFIPAGGEVVLDFGQRKVLTGVGELRQHPGFAASIDGTLLRWPRRVPAGEYNMAVDLVPWSDEIEVEVTYSEVAG